MAGLISSDRRQPLDFHSEQNSDVFLPFADVFFLLPEGLKGTQVESGNLD